MEGSMDGGTRTTNLWKATYFHGDFQAVTHFGSLAPGK